MLSHLKDIFLTIPIVLLSTTVISNILKYIRVSLKFSLLSQIYKQPYDCPNLTYIVSLIRKRGFKDLDFLIPSRSAIGEIPKTMIFEDKIDNAVEIAKYLQSRLFEWIQNKKDLKNIICTFSANLTTTSRSRFLANF